MFRFIIIDEKKQIYKNLFAIKSTAKINGDLYVGKLAIEPGSKFTGYCDMGTSEAASKAEPINLASSK